MIIHFVVDVNVNLVNNPTIVDSRIKSLYSSKVMITDVKNREIFAEQDYTVLSAFTSLCFSNEPL